MPFRFFSFSLSFSGSGIPYPADIIVFAQPLDRYLEKSTVSLSTLICLAPPVLATLPLDYDGFIVQRSSDGITFADISGIVRGAFFYVDMSISPGIYTYRARLRFASGTESAPGNEVVVSISSWLDADRLSVYESDIDGNPLDRLSRDYVFPDGTYNNPTETHSLSEGSLLGGMSGGLWYVPTKEYEAPIIASMTPGCGSVNVPLPLNVLIMEIQ